MVVSGSSDSSVRLWNLDSGKGSFILREKNLEQIASLVIAAKSGYIIAGSYDNAIRMWQISSGKLVKVLKGHKDWVKTISIYEPPEGETCDPLLLSGSFDSTIKIWESKKKSSSLLKRFGKK